MTNEEKPDVVKRFPLGDAVPDAEFIEYGEISYRKLQQMEKPPRIEVAMRLVVARENFSDAIDQIAAEFKHLREAIAFSSSTEPYYGPTSPSPGNRLRDRRK